MREAISQRLGLNPSFSPRDFGRGFNPLAYISHGLPLPSKLPIASKLFCGFRAPAQ